MEFFLGSRDPSKPEAIRLRVLKYKSCSNLEVQNSMEKITSKIKDDPSVSGDVVQHTALWNLIFSHDSKINTIKFINLILSSLEQMGTQNYLKEFAQNVIDSDLFSSTGSLICDIKHGSVQIIDEMNTLLEVLHRLCSSNMTHLQSSFEFLEELRKVIVFDVEKNALMSWMMKFLSLSMLHNNLVTDDAQYRIQSIIPSVDELMGTPLENDSNLSPVKRSSPYSSNEDYMDTYFRLLRTESFASIQKGISEMLDGTLDERDMKVYYNVHVVGFRSTSRSLNIAVSFQTISSVR